MAKITYICSDCGAKDVKLWRKAQAVGSRLTCMLCSFKDQGMDIDKMSAAEMDDVQRQGLIGWLVPAVPTEDMSSFWGLMAIPGDDFNWWLRLPARTPDQVQSSTSQPPRKAG